MDGGDVSADRVYWILWNALPRKIDADSVWKQFIDEGCDGETAALWLLIGGEVVSTTKGSHFRLVTDDTHSEVEHFE